MLFSQRETRRKLEVAPIFWGTQKTSLCCLNDLGAPWEGSSQRHMETEGVPYDFTKGGNGGRGRLNSAQL